MLKISYALIFCVTLFALVPFNVNAFTYDSCMPEHNKTKMMKNNDDTGRIYCVFLGTADVLEKRGWGTANSNYFNAYFEVSHQPTSIGRLVDATFFSVNVDKDHEKFKNAFSVCSKDPHLKCYIIFSNNTSAFRISLNPEPDITNPSCQEYTGEWIYGYSNDYVNYIKMD